MTIAVDGGKVIRGVIPHRFWTATGLAAALRLAGGRSVVATYGDRPGVAVGSPEAWRMITGLRRADDASG